MQKYLGKQQQPVLKKKKKNMLKQQGKHELYNLSTNTEMSAMWKK